MVHSSQDDGDATGQIRIIRVPEGEAPEHVRRAWVGLVLPCHRYLGPAGPERGVLTQESSSGRVGFSVPQAAALKVLASVRPEAAAWWKENGFPLEPPDDLFGFAEDEAEIVTGVSRMKIMEVPDEAQGQPLR
jgi:hypothetical protein